MSAVGSTRMRKCDGCRKLTRHTKLTEQPMIRVQGRGRLRKFHRDCVLTEPRFYRFRCDVWACAVCGKQVYVSVGNKRISQEEADRLDLPKIRHLEYMTMK